MSYRILLPGKNTIGTWTEFIIQNLFVPSGKEILYDLSNIPSLRPHHVVTLACLIERHRKSASRLKVVNTNQKTNQYLQEIGFIEYLNRDKRGNSHPQFPKSQTTLNLWQLEPEMVSLYPLSAQKFLEWNEFFGLDLDAVNISLSEIYNNIIDHSGCLEMGFTITQYYKERRVLETAVCDFGSGIPAKVLEYSSQIGIKISNDMEALKWAMIQGNSTKSSPRNRGFGLNNLSSCVRKLGGELRIVTNRAVLFQKASDEGFSIGEMSTHSFPGTLIVFHLNVDYFQSKELFEGDLEDIF